MTKELSCGSTTDTTATSRTEVQSVPMSIYAIKKHTILWNSYISDVSESAKQNSFRLKVTGGETNE